MVGLGYLRGVLECSIGSMMVVAVEEHQRRSLIRLMVIFIAIRMGTPLPGQVKIQSCGTTGIKLQICQWDLASITLLMANRVPH